MSEKKEVEGGGVQKDVVTLTVGRREGGEAAPPPPPTAPEDLEASIPKGFPFEEAFTI